MENLKVHTPLAIPAEDYKIGRLKPLSYSPEAISDAIMEYLLPPDPESKRGELAVQRYRTQPTWIMGNKNPLENLKTFFEIFNDVYFNGLLTGLCKIEFSPWWFGGRRFGNDIGGYCKGFYPGEETDPRFRIEKPYCLITIRETFHSRGPFDSTKWYLTVLLHEMLHAMFMLYTCRCSNGCFERAKSYDIIAHHKPWQRAAKELQLKDHIHNSWNNWLGMGIDFDSALALASDTEHGLPCPSDEDLKSMDIDIGKFKEHMDDIEKAKGGHEDSRKRVASMKPWYPMKASRCIGSQWTVDSYESNFGWSRKDLNRKEIDSEHGWPMFEVDRFKGMNEDADDAAVHDYNYCKSFVGWQRLPGFKPC